MKFTQKLLSLVTSLALACGMAANMLPVQAAAAQPAPTITLTADKTTVCVGEPVTLTVSIDGSKAAFAGLAATLQYDTSAFTFTGAVKEYKGSDYDKVTCPQLNEKNELSRLVLEADAAAAVNLGKVVSCTFIANKTGKTFAFSLSGDFSVKGTDSTDFSVSTNISVSAKTLTADVSESAKLSGTYGEDLSKKIQSDMVTFKDGDKTVKPEGTWSFSGSAPSVTDKEVTFRFTPKDTSIYAPLDVAFPVTITPKAVDPKLSVKPAEKMYDGNADLTADQKQKVAITLDGVIPADEGKVSADFSSIAYDAADSGERTITASGIELTGDQKSNYKLSADSCTAKGSITPYTGEVSVQENFITRSYNGKPQSLQEGELVLTANGKTLQSGKDYTITYPHGCTGTENADTEISYTLTGKGNYEGCTFTGSTFTNNTSKFTILARPLPTVKTGSSLGGAITAVYQQAYTLPTVNNDILNETNAQGTLSLRYKQGSGEWSTEAPAMPGEYTIGVYFESSTDKYSSGMLNGISTTLTIQKAEGSGSVAVNESYVYGEAITPETQNGTGEVSCTYTGRDGTTYAESSTAPTQVGSYTVTARFAETATHKACTATADFRIAPKSLAKEDFALSTTEFTYNGKVQKPAVSSPALKDGDYRVTAPESTNAGDYTLTVSGQGNYTGSVEYSYTIRKAEGSGSVRMANYAYGEAAPAPVAESATNGIDQVSYTYAGRDGTTYAESATAPTKVGSYTVTARFAATANATECTATADFSITAKGLVADDFTLSGTEFTYTGSEQKPAVSVAEGRDLAEGTDYAVQYPEASTNAGSYKVTVTGKGNYSGSVELSYKIKPAGYTLPQSARIVTELTEYPASIYGGQPLSHIGLKAEGLPEGAQFGWKAGDTKLGSNPGTASYEITVNPTDPNYSEGTATVSVKLVNAVVPADSKEGITNQLSTFAASISKTASENGALKAGASADIAKLTLSGKFTTKEQDDLKSAHLSDAALLAVLDKSADKVTVSTQLNKGDRGDKSALTGLAITTGGKAALGAANGTATYTAKDITPEKPADGQLIEVELSLGSGQQPAVPVLVSLSFNAKNADPNGKFQVVHKHTETDPGKNFTTQYDCRSVSKSGDTVTVQFLAASFSSFSIQYTAPASGGSSSSSSSGAAPKPDDPQPQPTATPALTASETTWLGGYGALLNAKSGTALSLDVTACEYLPGYIITGVQKSGVTLNLSTPAGKLCLSPAVAKAMNGSYNYTFADALAIAGKVAAAAKPAASSAPVKDPTAASPTPAPTPVPTAAPQPTQAPAPQPEAEPQEKSHSPLPMVAAVLVAAALLAGGYLAYNSASRRKALHDVYAPSKKVNLNQNQNNGRSRK